jgi:hypothetical protein
VTAALNTTWKGGRLISKEILAVGSGGPILIDRLKLSRVERGQVIRARLSTIRLLESADLRPPGLPPSAVLIVGQMHDPLPGKVAKNWSVGRVNQEWESRARGQMAEFHRRAARPAQGPVPPGAHAVLFKDEGELMACLALDFQRGLVQERWWWRSLLRKVSNSRGGFSGNEASVVLVGQMLRRPQAAAAAISWLASRGMSGEALMALTPLQAGQVLQAIAAAYQLTVVQFLPSLPAGPPAYTPGIKPPWDAAPSPAGFGRERTALVGLSMDLKARPETVRTREYQHRVSAWWKAAASGESAPLRSVDTPSGAAITPSPPDRRKDEPLSEVLSADQWFVVRQKPMAAEGNYVERERVERTGFQKAASRGIGFMQNAGSEVQLPSAISTGQTALGTTCQVAQIETQTERLPPVASSADPAEESSREDVRTQNRRYFSPPPARKVEALQEQPEPAAGPILYRGKPTELGGVLYLINMMAVLNLPDCFEAGWRLASGVGAWGTLDALARELLGDELPQLQDDPLWAALAHLDGRQPDQPPGFRLPRTRPHRWPDFELPPDWLKNLPELDLASLSRASLRQIRAAYPPLLAGWLGRVLPFITARLRLALRLTPQVSLAHALLLVPGKFYLTPSNLDLVASIESISLAVRMAGLDSDPGWVPEFGRFIRFHFE